MKSIEIKSLIALLVITMTLSASLMRETKAASKTARKSKAKTTTTSDGSGSWALGYDCPYIEVLNSQQIVTETSGRWSFKPTTIDANNGFGFVMDGQVIPGLAKFVQLTTNNEKYVPWRFFDNVTYEKKSASNKMIVCMVRNDQGEKTTLRFNLPHKWFGSYVDVKQANDLKSLFSKYADKQKNDIQSHKNIIDSMFGQLQSATRAQLTAQQNEAQLIAEVKANIQKNQALLVTKRQQLKTFDDQIQAARPAIQGLNNSADAILAEIQAMDQQQSNNILLINDESRKELFVNVEKALKKEADDVTRDLNALKLQVPSYNMDFVIQASVAGDVTKTAQLLAGIQPN